MIINKIKCNFTPLQWLVIIGLFQICNSISLDCFNWSFMIMANIIRRSLLLILLNKIDIDKWIAKVMIRIKLMEHIRKVIFLWI